VTKRVVSKKGQCAVLPPSECVNYVVVHWGRVVSDISLDGREWLLHKRKCRECGIWSWRV